MDLKNTLFNNDIIKRSRLPWVDYAKGIAIILVAYRHIVVGFLRSGLSLHPYLINANEIFYSFRMPLFFILSGLFIGRSLAKHSRKYVVLSKCKNLLYPYVLWASLQITLQIVFSHYTNSERGPKDFLYLVTNPDALDQMWYLFALFNVAILYIFLRFILKIKTIYQLLIGLVFYYLSAYTNGTIRDILFFYIYYSLGDFISVYMLDKSNIRYFASRYTFFILLPLFIISQWYFLQHENMRYHSVYPYAVVALIGCAFMLNICFQLQNWGKLKTLRVVGYHSLYIYIMHVMVVAFLRYLFIQVMGIRSIALLLFINLFLGITICIIIYNLAIRMGLWFLFTLDKKYHIMAESKNYSESKINKHGRSFSKFPLS